MFCKFCGANLEDNATFCHECGNQTNQGEQAPSWQAPPTVQPNYYNAQQPKQPISVGGWIGRSLIPYIPIAGGLIFLIMLFIWSGDTTKEASFCNWAKAQLILLAIAVAIIIIVVVIAITAGFSIIDYLDYL